MSKRIQCESCENAEYGEDLYEYSGEILCRYCIVSKVCETTIPCEYFGECNDTTKKTKKCNCDKKNQRIAELEAKIYNQCQIINFAENSYALLQKQKTTLEIELGTVKYNLDLEVEAKQNLLQIKEDLEKKLAEYENIGTVEDFKELKEQRIIVTRGRGSGKLITEKALKYDLLKKELAKLKANAILPKFKIGDEIWAVVSYITENEADIYNNVIETGIVQKIEIYKRKLEYWCDKGRIYWEDKFVKLFATKEEAQQKLKELEE